MQTHKADGSVEYQDWGCQTKSCPFWRQGAMAHCDGSFDTYVKCKNRTHIETPPVILLKKPDLKV